MSFYKENPKPLIDFETDQNVKVSGTFKEYDDLLSRMLVYLQKMLCDFKMMELSMLCKEREFFQYKSGHLVYIILSLTS